MNAEWIPRRCFGFATLIVTLMLTERAPARVQIVGGNRCDNLAYEVCRRNPGQKSSDATGTQLSGLATESAEVKKTIADTRTAVRPHVPGILQNWRERGIYENRIRSLGLDRDPACRPPARPESAPCVERLAGVVEATIATTSGWGGQRLPSTEFPELKGVDIMGIMDITGDSRTKFVSDLVGDQFARSQNTPQMKERLSKQFDLVKSNFVEVLKEKFAGNAGLDDMVAKVNQVKFEGTDCRRKDRSIASFFSTNANYRDSDKSVRVCYGLAMNDSLYNLTMTLGHEIGHSIDPCRTPLPARGLSERVFGRSANTESEAAATDELPTADLTKCLRGKASIGARRLSPFAAPKGFCADDQIGEAMADWMAIEVMAKMLKKGQLGPTGPDQVAQGMANTYADMCTSAGSDQGSGVHPATRLRIERIAMVHPEIRRLMECGPLRPGQKYCPADSPSTPPPTGDDPGGIR